MKSNVSVLVLRVYSIFKYSERLDPYVLACVVGFSGMGPDSRVLVSKSRKQAIAYNRLYQVSDSAPA